MSKRGNDASIAKLNPKAMSQCRLDSDFTFGFDDASLEIDVSSISGDLDEKKWFSSQVFMSWRGSNRIAMKVGNLKMDIVVSGPGISAQTLGTFVGLQDLVKVSLRGARLVKKKAPGYVPFSIHYDDGVAFKVVESKSDERAGVVFNSWKIREEAQSADNDWFSTPPQPSSDDELAEDKEFDLSQRVPSPSTSRMTSSNPSLHKPVEVTKKQDQERPPSSQEGGSTTQGADMADTGTSQAGDHEGFVKEPINKSSVQQQRSKRLRKCETRHINQSKRQRVTPYGDAPNKVKSRVKEKQNDVSENSRKKRRDNHGRHLPPSSPVRPVRNPALDHKAGLNCEGHTYPALDKLKAASSVSLIGIVSSCSGIKTARTGQMFVTLSIVDPSRYTSTFSLNVFADPGFVGYLPNPSSGHVIILREVKITSFNDDKSKFMGVVYKDRLSWTAFNPDTGRFYHRELKGASPVNMQGGMPGAVFTPFYHPTGETGEKELEYCSNMGEWWRALQEQADATRVQILPKGKTREHRLIGETDVDIFFDATVEVVRVGENEERGQRLVLITDYTSHNRLSRGGPMGAFGHTTFTNRLPPELLENPTEGTYWSLRNLRLKVNSNGHIEIDLFEAKWTQLSLDECDNFPTVQALLERKKAYESSPLNPNNIVAARDGEVSLISQIETVSYVNLVVELLFTSRENDERTDLYVTDYTVCSNGTTYRPTAMQNALPHIPFFKISVWKRHDGSNLNELSTGTFYRLFNVRVIQDSKGRLLGSLDRAEETVLKVTQKASETEDIIALKRRKFAFYGVEDVLLNGVNTMDKSDGESKEQALEIQPININTLPAGTFALHCRHTDQIQSTFKQIRANRKWPNKFRVVARVVDYFPLDISKFAWRRCAACHKRIPDRFKACNDCGDMEHKYVEWLYRFFLTLEDGEGECVNVSVCDEAPTFLLGLKPTDFESDPDALEKLKTRLNNLFGNLIDVHEGVKKNEEIKPTYGPYLNMAIKSWRTIIEGDEVVAYALTGCSLREIEKTK